MVVACSGGGPVVAFAGTDGVLRALASAVLVGEVGDVMSDVVGHVVSDVVAVSPVRMLVAQGVATLSVDCQ